MQDFLIEVINYIPSYYPFTEKDGSIGVADFFSQQPVSNFKKLHDDPVYRNFQATCDVIGVPVGPCNKLLKGSLLECVRKPPPPVNPPPICQGNNGISLPCRCNCPGSCLYNEEINLDYIENWNRQELLQLIDSSRIFPIIQEPDLNELTFDDDYNRTISHELAGNAYWIGLPPSCDGIWITIASCEDNEFMGFYKLPSPSFGKNNSVQLKGRGQRIKIETETPGVYKKYQVYYSYEFEYKLNLTPPNEMTFRLASENIVLNAENDPLSQNQSPDAIDTYSRFCYDEFVSFTMRNCIKNNNTLGTLTDIPCVCEKEFDTNFTTTDIQKFVLKKDVPEKILKYGTFSLEDEQTGYSMNASFNRDSPIAAVDPALKYQYYDAFSGDIIGWDQEGTWENSGNETNWYSWTRKQAFDAFKWDDSKIKESCYSSLKNKKAKNDERSRIEIPPCENVICGRVEINANPDGSVFELWKDALENINSSANITSSQMLEWDMLSKFGFPTDFIYNPYSSETSKNKWYDEIKNRFVVNGVYLQERNQFIIPCYPTLTCEEGSFRITNIIDIIRSCSSKYDSVYFDKELNSMVNQTATGELRDLFIGVDYRPNLFCSNSCPDCTPSECCASNNGIYKILSSPIGRVAYNIISAGEEDKFNVKEALNKFNLTYMECYLKNCNSASLENIYKSCLENPVENCNDDLETCCKDYAAKICVEEYENNESFRCNNQAISEEDFNRINENNWTFKGIPLDLCEETKSLGAPFNCLYEIEPVLQSNIFYIQSKIGQCEVSTVEDQNVCPGISCTYAFTDKRTAPFYFAGRSGSHTCPVTFCSKCYEGTFSECSCCGISDITSDDNRLSQSVYNECESCVGNNCCPSCCSVCEDNGSDICLINSDAFLPNWSSQEPCGVTNCEKFLLEFDSCVIGCLPTNLKGDECDNDCSIFNNKCDCDALYKLYEECVGQEYTEDGTKNYGGLGGSGSSGGGIGGGGIGGGG